MEGHTDTQHEKAARVVEVERIVTALYKGLLHRAPDDVGFRHYVARLLAGDSVADLFEEFFASDEYTQLHRIKMYVPRGHFYSPIVDPSDLRELFERISSRGVVAELPGIRIDKERMLLLWDTLVPLMQSNPFSEEASPGLRYRFKNPAYSWADGSVLHAMMRLYQPRRVIEIGSGWSSACMLDTIERHFNQPCSVTFIEPYPELLTELLGSKKLNATIIDKPVQRVPAEFFDVLESGDFLFIDSTHVLRTGGDVCYELFEILPRLKPGVIVHIHDMFWPFEYPKAWAIDDNRSWNELYAVRAMLADNPTWEIVFFNDYFAQISRDKIQESYPDFLRKRGGALWIERTSASRTGALA